MIFLKITPTQFLSATSGFICHPVRSSLPPSVGQKKSNSKFSALVLDRDQGLSRGHQSDDEDEDEDDDEEVNVDKDDNQKHNLKPS